MKPGKTFNLSKSTKASLATIIDPHKRGQWKRAMIDAQLCSEVVPKTEKRDRNAPRGGTATYVTNDTGTASTQV